MLLYVKIQRIYIAFLNQRARIFTKEHEMIETKKYSDKI